MPRRLRAIRAQSHQPRDLKRGLGTERLPRALPLLRSDCEQGHRPCPYVSCKYHLYADVSHIGSIKINFPDLEPEQLQHSCVLDIAEQQGATLEVTAVYMNLTRERVRQLEQSALQKLETSLSLAALASDLDDSFP